MIAILIVASIIIIVMVSIVGAVPFAAAKDESRSGEGSGYYASDGRHGDIDGTFENVVFMGDSLTVGLANSLGDSSYPEVTGKLNTTDPEFKGSIFYAKVGANASYGTGKVDQLPQNIRGIWIMFGPNEGWDPSYEKTLIDKLVQKCGNNIPIYVSKSLAMGEGAGASYGDSDSAINTFNTEIEKYCKNYNNVKCIDCSEGLIDGNGNLKKEYVEPDNQHPNSSAGKIFTENMKKEMLKSSSTGTGSGTSDSVQVNSADYDVVANALDFQQYISAQNHCQRANSAWGDACLGFSMSYCDAIYTKNFSKALQVVDNGPTGLQHYGYSGRKDFSSKDEMLKVVYDEIMSNRPIIIHVNGNVAGTSRHYVAAVGLKKGTTRNSIQETDILIIDVWDAKLESMNGKGSGTRFITNGRDCGWDYSYQVFKYF